MRGAPAVFRNTGRAAYLLCSAAVLLKAAAAGGFSYATVNFNGSTNTPCLAPVAKIHLQSFCTPEYTSTGLPLQELR
jgi:hypothetical protein